MIDVLSFGEPLVGFYPTSGQSLAGDSPIVKTWGGDTSNLALGIARLGHSSRYLTRVGDDPFGEGFLSLWKRHGVDTSRIVKDPLRRTGLYFVSFEDKKHILTYYRENSAASAISPEMVTEELVTGCKVIHLSGISIGMSRSALETGQKLVHIAKKHHVMVSFDINYRSAQWNSPTTAARTLAETIGTGVTILEITDDEMAALGWGTDIRHLGTMFPDCKHIVLKQGMHGAQVLSEGKTHHFPAIHVIVKDTVGAGDSFDAGYITALLEGASVEEAGRFASATAAHTCTGTGPLECMPTRNQVDTQLNSICS